MPRRSQIDNQIISGKISKLKGEGYGPRQATAIAMRMYRDGELPRQAPKKRLGRPKAQRARRASSTLSRYKRR